MPEETVVAPAPVVAEPVKVGTEIPVKDAGRDVLGDALKAPKQARYFNQREQKFEQYKPVEAVSTSSEAPVVVSTATGTSAPVSTSTAVVSTSTATSTSVETPVTSEKKLYAGKFETAEAMEAAYVEAQKAFHTKAQEVAELKKQIPPPDPKVTAEKTAEEKAALLNRIIDDPGSIVREIEARTQAAIQQQRQFDEIRDNWRKENADIAEHETYVGYEAARLFALDPSLETAAMLTQATTNFRAMHGKIREAGKHEALQVRSSVTPLGESRIQTPPPSEQPATAPKSEEQIRNDHVAFLKDQHARVRRLN